MSNSLPGVRIGSHSAVIFSVSLTVSPQCLRGSILVSPGRNGVPEQVIGLAEPDFAGRLVAWALAVAGWTAHVPDYCPHTEQNEISARLDRMFRAEAAHRSEGLSLGLVLMELGVTLARLTGSGLFGHSVGVFLAAAVSARSGSRAPIVLASGTAPITALEENPAAAFYDQRQAEPARFEDLLACSRSEAAQIQIGLRDTLLPADLQWQTARAVAERRPGVDVLTFDMGHDADHAAAVAHFSKINAK